MNAFHFVELWTLRWQQVASVFGVRLSERCGLWLDVASVRPGVAVKVGASTSAVWVSGGQIFGLCPTR